MKTIAPFLLVLAISSYAQGQNKLYDYDVEKRIEELGIVLVTPKLPPGINIEFATKTGNLIYLSGTGPTGDKFIGKVGKDLTIEQGYEAARSTAISHLSYLEAAIGDLNKVVKIVKVLGLVTFKVHPHHTSSHPDYLETQGPNKKSISARVGVLHLHETPY